MWYKEVTMLDRNEEGAITQWEISKDKLVVQRERHYTKRERNITLTLYKLVVRAATEQVVISLNNCLSLRPDEVNNQSQLFVWIT